MEKAEWDSPNASRARAKSVSKQKREVILEKCEENTVKKSLKKKHTVTSLFS